MTDATLPPKGDRPKANSKSSRVWVAIRSAGAMCIAAGAFYCLSFFSYFAFFIGARLTHSVPVARAFDAVGSLFLLPGRLLLWKLPLFIAFLPSVIVPVNTGAWFVLLCVALLLHQRFSGHAK